MERRQSILGSLKGKFGRKSQESTRPQFIRGEEDSRMDQSTNLHPERQTAPPTRRPSKC